MNDIVVTMTSWRKRIKNVSIPIVSLLMNTIKPRSIELNLSEEEFPNKEADLPETLLLLAETTCLNINWVGKNTKSFKKLIPTLKKYWNEKDLRIFTADDDIIYDKDALELFLRFSNEHPEKFISFGHPAGAFERQIIPRGGATMYKVGFFNEHIFSDLTKDIIDTNEDDWYYAYHFIKYNKRGAHFTGKPLKFFDVSNGHNYSTINTKAVLRKHLRQDK